ncbi:MAG: hypothetical protein IPP17_24815 [Bacteroidetes bacterium]|nr:hypothetical protein [Bacteroidota bacterium]
MRKSAKPDKQTLSLLKTLKWKWSRVGSALAVIARDISQNDDLIMEETGNIAVHHRVLSCL